MGYRSDVLFAVRAPKKDWQKLRFKLGMVRQEWFEELIGNLGEFDRFTMDDQGILIQANQWKWYVGSYTLVDAVEEALKYFLEEAEQHDSIDVIFLRIGEDMGDFQETYANMGYEIASISREIILD
jgi:hypothetical protein